MEICGLFWEFVATPWEEKFGCYHDSKVCLIDLKSHVVLSYQWQFFFL